MQVRDRIDVGPCLVDRRMQIHLLRRNVVLRSRHLVTLEVHGDEILRGALAKRDRARCDQDAIPEADTQIAAGAGDQTAVVDEAAVVGELLAELLFGC